MPGGKNIRVADKVTGKGVVLVTGANGFVGRALCKRLAMEGFIVHAAVRCLERNHEFPGNRESGVEWVAVEDIGPDTDWAGTLRGVDVVIHLAARVHVMKETAPDPAVIYDRVNFRGTERLARQAAEAGIERFVFLSTVKVNGEATDDVPFAETDPVFPLGPYAMSKWRAEKALSRIAEETQLKVTVLRIPLVYGPGVGGNFLRLMKWIYWGIPLPLAGIKNRRSLLYLGNLVDALMACAVTQSAAGKTFFVSDDEDVSTPELIRRLAAAMGKNARLFHLPISLLRFADKRRAVNRLSQSLVVDSSAIRRETGWTPPYSMDCGLGETAKWFLNSLSRRRAWGGSRS